MKTCPSCNSSNIRNGYLKPPLPLRLLLVREFLCEGCNFQFRAFALRPAKSRGPHLHHKVVRFNQAPAVDLSSLKDSSSSISSTRQASRPLDQPMTAPPKPAEQRELLLELQGKQPQPQATPDAAEHHLSSYPSRPCPQCGSHDARRRHRSLWERAILSLIGLRAYACQACGTSFYARRAKHPPTAKPLTDTR